VTTNYKRDLKRAIGDLLLMNSERMQLETKIAKQKKRVAALYELVQTDEDGPALSGLVEGISDACRVVMRAAEKPLFPAEVRDGVQALGLPPQANLLASVHTTLKRMKEAEEMKEVSKPLETGGKGIAYQWAGEKMVSLSALSGYFDLSKNAIEAYVKSKGFNPDKSHRATKLKPRRNAAFHGTTNDFKHEPP
jgi:hypothetical protein